MHRRTTMLLEPFVAAVIPLILVIVGTADGTLAVPEILVHRMQQLDINGVQHGCRSSLMNLEARTFRTINQVAGSFARKCVLVRVLDLISDESALEGLLTDAMVGGLLIILPDPANAKFSKSQLDALVRLEKNLLVMQSANNQKPIYFVQDSAMLTEKYEQIDRIASSQSQNSNDSSSLPVQYLNMVLSNAIQMVTSSPVAAIKDPIFTNIEAKLTGHGNEDQLPTIVLSAYYDAFGVAPGLSFGANENASGLVALLELARIFGRLYAQRTPGKTNLIFLLTAAGKQNYLGTKKYIDEQLDNRDNSLLSEALFVMSLESLVATEQKDQLYMHVSKVPKDKTAMANFFKYLQEAANAKSHTSTMINKKINLADEAVALEGLAFEHERFGFRRLPAFTVSGSAKSPKRASIFDSCDSVDLELLATNIEIIAEALASQIYPQMRTKKEFFSNNELKVSRQYIKATFAEICSQPRSQQLLLTKPKGNNNYVVSPFVLSLETMIKKSVRNVVFHHAKLDREPELVFYEPTSTTLNIYDVKHALFDLILSVGIASYLLTLYLFLTNFERLSTFVKSIKGTSESPANGVTSSKTKRKNVKSS